MTTELNKLEPGAPEATTVNIESAAPATPDQVSADGSPTPATELATTNLAVARAMQEGPEETAQPSNEALLADTTAFLNALKTTDETRRKELLDALLKSGGDRIWGDVQLVCELAQNDWSLDFFRDAASKYCIQYFYWAATNYKAQSSFTKEKGQTYWSNVHRVFAGQGSPDDEAMGSMMLFFTHTRSLTCGRNHAASTALSRLWHETYHRGGL